jgi:hypothetical protein
MVPHNAVDVVVAVENLIQNRWAMVTTCRKCGTGGTGNVGFCGDYMYADVKVQWVGNP